MVQSVERTLDVLEVIASSDDEVSLSEVCERVGLPLGTVHRLLGTLLARGYAVQNKATRHYGPGPRLLEVAARAANNQRFDLRRIGREALRELTAATGETSNLLLRRGSAVVYVEQVVSQQTVRMFTEVGQHAPLYCTGGGKAILASLPAGQLEAYLAATRLEPHTTHTITTPEQLRRELEETRQRGFALDNEEHELGVRCVAAPIFDHSGACVAALSISGPATRLSAERALAFGPLVRQAAAICSAQLGYGGAAR
ncbi:MAG: IclR family transcriptional regulator [Chloroflexi bacterium OHK40]